MEELATNNLFIIITGSASLLGLILSGISLFLVSKIYNNINIKTDNSITNIKSNDKSTVLKDSIVKEINVR